MSVQDFFARLEYNGAGFNGWQIQPDVRTVQQVVEAALSRICNRPIRIVAAGRTDTGVHALGQTISFTAPDTWNPVDLQRGLNAILPDDVWIADLGPAPEGFNARKEASARAYQYVIGFDEAAASPFRVGREWHVRPPPSREALESGARYFLGEHDFTAFAAVGQDKPHYRCVVGVSTWEEREDGKGVIFHVQADRFLHHMVRFMVGTLVDVGLGKRPLDDIPKLLEAANNSETSSPAPPQGLYLVRVDYPRLKQHK